jgi:hypothetical protein
MSLIDLKIEEEIQNFLSDKKFKNIYLFSKNMTGSGKSTIINKTKDFCFKNKIPFIYIKNLCSIEGGIKINNLSKKNLDLILESNKLDNKVILCDEVKDRELYKKLKNKNIFVCAGYSPNEDVGETLHSFDLIDLDNQFGKEELISNIKVKYPENIFLIEKIMDFVPNLGQFEICFKEILEGRLKIEELKNYSEKLKNPSFWKEKNLEHFFIFEEFDKEIITQTKIKL